MVDPVNVWGAVDERGRPRPRTCRFEKDSAKKAALDEHCTDAETWVDLQCCHGWTVRPMRLVDGHGEQAFDPKLFDTVRECASARAVFECRMALKVDRDMRRSA